VPTGGVELRTRTRTPRLPTSSSTADVGYSLRPRRDIRPRIVTIRQAVISDSSEIARLTAELGYAAGVDAIADRLARIGERKDSLLLVAVWEETMVGWLQAQTSEVLESGFRAEIVGLIVSDVCRRRGVGRSLVQHAERWAMEVGAEAVVVRSNTKRSESHLFYPALGFCASKTQAVYRKQLITRPA
jgi:GNAT superfamily N-acetyltransferase